MSRVRRARAVAVIGLLTAALTAFTAPDQSPAEKPDRPMHAQYDEYVALGDSYTAGPLIQPIRLDRPLGCVVSARNYPARLAGYLDVDSYRDASCSGARTRDLTHRQTTAAGINPPQLDAVRRGTDLVTLGMGGNDFGLFGSIIDVCPTLREQDPNGAPCRRKYTIDGIDTLLRDARRIGDRVAANLRAIHHKAPHATVVVVDYLRILPQHGTCEGVPLAKGDYRWADRVERRLNASLRKAAQQSDATYVPMYRASRGHDACAGSAAWVNDASIDPLRAAMFHPYASGMKAIAQEAYQVLTKHTAPRAAAAFDVDAPVADRALARQLARYVSGG